MLCRKRRGQGLLVGAPWVARFARLDRRVKVHLEERRFPSCAAEDLVAVPCGTGRMKLVSVRTTRGGEQLRPRRSDECSLAIGGGEAEVIVETEADVVASST